MPTYTGVPNQLTVPINNVSTPVTFLDSTVLFAPKLDRYYYQSAAQNFDFINVNRSLQSYVDILPGTPITIAKGTIIGAQDAINLQDDNNTLRAASEQFVRLQHHVTLYLRTWSFFQVLSPACV